MSKLLSKKEVEEREIWLEIHEPFDESDIQDLIFTLRESQAEVERLNGELGAYEVDKIKEASGSNPPHDMSDARRMISVLCSFLVEARKAIMENWCVERFDQPTWCIFCHAHIGADGKHPTPSDCIVLTCMEA